MEPPAAVEELLAQIVQARPFDGHDGRSGAVIERALLADGRTIIVKRSDPTTDFTMGLAGDVPDRERLLWATGVLDRLPAGIGHAVLASGWVDGQLVTCMADVGQWVLRWSDTIVRADLDRLFCGLAAMHHEFAGAAPDGLLPLEERLTLFAPSRVSAIPAEGLGGAVLRGWECFAELVPGELAGAIFASLADPSGIARELSRLPATMLHADAWMVNIALCPERLVLLDWNIATAGPGILDAIVFASGCASHVDLPLDGVVESARRVCGADVDDKAWRSVLFWVLCEQGWNKALDATDASNPRERSRARAELQWWTARALDALEAGPVA